MVQWPLEHIGEILVDGQWQRLPSREDPRVTIARGYSAQSSRTLPKPGECSITIDNRDKEHSPRNPNSGLFEKIGRGTEFRFRVGDLPDDPDPELIDTFDRTETGGWGDADTGQTWEIYDPFGVSPPASDYSVDDGTGRINLDTLNESRFIRADGVDLADFEATYTLTTDQVSVSDNTRDSIRSLFLARLDSTNHSYYGLFVSFRTDSGLPDGAGRRVTVAINHVEELAEVIATNVQSVPGLLYTPGTPLRVRVKAQGAELKLRVWEDGQDEPAIWHSQLYDENLTSGEIGFRSLFTSDGTTTPITLEYGDLEIVEPAGDTGVVRMRGEIPEWQPSRDLSGADLRVPIKPAGILRRLGTGQDPLKSTMRRHIPLVRPLAYWPMEEGRQGEDQVANAAEGTDVAPLQISGFDFAKDSDLIGSDPLPKLTGGDQSNDFMVSDGIPGQETGFWAVEMVFRISEQDFPDGSDEKTMLAFVTTGSSAQRYILSLFTSSGNPTMKLTIRDDDGTELDSAIASHDAAIAGGGPGLLDEWRQLRIQVGEDGADLDWRFDWIDPVAENNWGNGDTLTSTSAGRVNRIDTYFGSEAASDNHLKGLALGHLSVWGVRFHTGFQDGLFRSPVGLRGQITRPWLRRLHVDADIPLEISGLGAEPLGPYPTGAFLDLLGQAVRTEMGLLTESRTSLGLEYRTADTLYNQTPALVLNWANGEISRPFKATDDDKNVRNRITVKRREGSEATEELTEGRLSTRPAPDGIGLLNTSVETIVDTDEQLPGQAMWRLHVATVDEMRVTQLTLKMGNPRMRGLVSDVLTIDVGDRLRVINTPAEYNPDGFDLLVVGYKETFANGVWDITFACEPYTPYNVAEVAEDLYEDFEDTTLALDITDDGDAAWARDDAEAHTGSWSLKSGTITDNQTSDAIVAVPEDAESITFWYKVSSEESGSGFDGDFLAVLVDGNEELRAQGEVDWTQHKADVSAASTVTFRYSKDSSVSEGDDAAWIDDVSIRIKSEAPVHVDLDSELDEAISSSATSFDVATEDGGSWIDSASSLSDFPFDIRVGGEVMTVTAITGTSSPQTFTVTRSVNGVVKSHASGAGVRLAATPVVALAQEEL